MATSSNSSRQAGFFGAVLGSRSIALIEAVHEAFSVFWHFLHRRHELQGHSAISSSSRDTRKDSPSPKTDVRSGPAPRVALTPSPLSVSPTHSFHTLSSSHSPSSPYLPSPSSASSPSIPPPPSPSLVASPALPPPNIVRERGRLLRTAADTDKSVWRIEWDGVEMIVKGGKDVKLEEAEWTEMVREQTNLPVPKIYGTRTHGDATFLYIQFLPGETFGKAVPFLLPSQRASIIRDLSEYIRSLHAVTAPPSASFGGFGGRNLFALSRHSDYPASIPPLRTSSAVVDWLRTLYIDNVGSSVETWSQDVLPLLSSPSAGDKLVLVHGDVTLSNVLVQDGHVSGIIDWETCGWYPAWVEDYVAARYVRRFGGADTDSLDDWLGEALWGQAGRSYVERLCKVGEAFRRRQ